MCGVKPCRTCSLKSKISGNMRKSRTRSSRKINVNNLTKQLAPTAALGAGFLISNIVNKVTFIKENPNYAAGAKVVGGLALAIASKDKIVANVGTGVAVSGAVDFMNQAGIGDQIKNLIGSDSATTLEGARRLNGARYRSMAAIACPPQHEMYAVA